MSPLPSSSPADSLSDSFIRSDQPPALTLEQKLADAVRSRRILLSVLEDQQLTEARLRDMTRLLQDTGRLARVGGWEIHASDLRVVWTPEVHTLCGTEAGFRPTLESFGALIHPDDAEKFAAFLRDSWASKEPCEAELRLVPPGKKAKWVRMLGHAVWHGGTLEKLAGAIQDIDDLRLAQTELEKREAQLSELVASVDGIVWEADAQTFQFLFVSAQAERILGYPAAEWLRRPDFWPSIILDEDRARAVSYCLGETRAGRSHSFEYRVKSADGRIVWLRDIVNVSTLPDGRRLLRGILLDITERREIEEASRRTAERIKLVLSASRMGVWRVHLSSGQMEWDARMREIHALRADDAVPTLDTYRFWIHAADRPQAENLFSRGPESRQKIDCRFSIDRRDGRSAVVRFVGTNPNDGAKDDGWIAGVCEDVTEKAESERKQKQLEERLIQTQRLETVGTLAGGIAHDFNNILTGILGFIDLAAEETSKHSPAAGYLLQARRGAIQSRDMIKRLLLFARRAPTPGTETLDFGRVVRESVPLLTAAIPSNVSLETEIEEAPVFVDCDKAQMQQVVMNLCVNAAQAIGLKPGRILLSLRIIAAASRLEGAAKLGAKCVELSLTDNGCGMDAETVARIFDPFFTTKAAGEGTGLGLSIVHGIVHEHGGSIQVESTPGVGTRFAIFLPLAQGTSEQPTKEAPALPKLDGRNRRVMLVDDDASVLAFTKVALSQQGFAVEDFPDGFAALRAFEAEPQRFSLAIVDLCMPGKSGIEVLEQIRRRRADLPIVLTSGDFSRYEQEEVNRHASVWRMQKPFSLEEIVATVKATTLPTEG
jgi:PAS domain S-box-containing protein